MVEGRGGRGARGGGGRGAGLDAPVMSLCSGLH